MAGRQQLIRDAFAALERGDTAKLRGLFAPDAEWVGIPHEDAAGICANRREVLDLLESHHANGRHFALGRMIEARDRVAVEVAVTSSEWSGPVETFKVFAFRSGEDVVVRLNDCIDESYALQVLAA
jgi:ketosteroid isomerase-like protein